MNFRKFQKEDVKSNIFKNFDDNWLLVSAGTPENYNTMTASWGGMGFVWAKPVFFLVIRKNRYTYEFLKKNDIFTCSYFDENYKEALTICGSKSGRDTDKVTEAGLTVQPIPGHDAITFKEAKHTFICRKVLNQELEESGFDNKELYKEFYEGDEHHVLFVGTIEEFGE